MIFYFLIALIIIILAISSVVIGYRNKQTITCKIKDKWIKRTSKESSDKYLIKCGSKIYKVSDLLFKGKFNSADIYGNLEVGKTYKIETTGYRIGFISEYQNINSYKEVKENKNDK